MKTTVIFAHPDVENGSIGNKIVLDALNDTTSVEVRELYKMYPNRIVDVEVEQQALLNTDVIVLQFPFYWFGVPSLLKEWMDTVLTHSFAYGPDADHLKGKQLLLSTTVGGREELYSATGAHLYAVEDYLKPFYRLASATGMIFLKPEISYGVSYNPTVENRAERDRAANIANEHACRLIERIALEKTLAA
ncbi:NAD(P)H-dependent oxidoreductase [Vibrio apostichopi]|uniref:NAD(P)H-dependent oxidoreductase n=1 Tax=Vibrio apostichopi TaxID=3035453 RepID=UPI00257271FE|nr:NAD(P)H-dependent oxidoreductase [Vibrio sp. FE10]